MYSFIPLTLWACRHQTHESDIFIEPDAPVDSIFVVYAKLFSYKVVSCVVDFLRIGFGFRICVYGAELPILDRGLVACHEVCLSDELSL